MNELVSGKRRSARRAALYAVAFALFLSGYASSYLGLMWLYGHGSIPKPTALFLGQYVFGPPVTGYYDQQFPGWKYLWVAEKHAYYSGRGVPISEPDRQAIDDMLGTSSENRPDAPDGTLN